MLVADRKELLADLARVSDPDEIYAIGMLLMAISMAKQGETLQDTIDFFRRHLSEARRLEDIFRSSWDNLRNWK